MNREKLIVRQREITSELGEMYEKAKNRELTADEKNREETLSREYKVNQMKITQMGNEKDLAAMREGQSKNAKFREVLKKVASERANREILLNATDTNLTANIEASGAIALNIQDMIPTLHEGLGLPEGVRIVTGVTGNELYPVSVNDATIQEVGEAVILDDQTLDFDKVTVKANRTGLAIPVSRAAIENAAFDLLGFVQQKITKATQIYLAEKIYSPVVFDGNKGPYSGQTPTAITLDENAYANILDAVAEFSDNGFFDGDVCISMSRKTEAYLKALPKVPGAAAGFVIENGLCAGYPYTVSHFVNTKLENGAVVPDVNAEYLEIGYWEWFALQQHGTASLIVDATSSDVAMKDIVRVIFNAYWSMTDLSEKINGGHPVTSEGVTTYPSQAFKLYAVSRS